MSYRPAVKSGSPNTKEWNGSEVGTPATIVSRTARLARAIATVRSGPQTTSFARSGSYLVGTVSGAARPESMRIPEPLGSRTNSILPPCGTKPSNGSSAVIRSSMAAPDERIAPCANGSRSPAATRSWSATRSRPVTASVTGCSTWRRVFISRNTNVPSGATRNSAVPAFS